MTKRRNHLKTVKKASSPTKIALHKFAKNKIAMASLVFLILVAIISIIAPLLAPLPIKQQDLLNIKGDMTSQNILGTDSGGRDNFSRLLFAGRMSLTIGLVSTIGMLVIGIAIGVISGYFGGILDTLLMRVTEFVMLFPFLIFAIVLNAALGDKIKNPYGSAIILVAVIIVLSWGGIARLVRGKVMQEKENEYFLAAKSIGTPTHKIILKHLLPNILSVVIVQATLTFAGMIVVESGLSFLGFGISKSIPSWGNMLSDAQEGDIISSKPWIWMPPALMIMFTILSINFVGEGLKDAFNPKGRK
ncbi:oligopeptide ABC transporter permease [Staphylococcus sp. GDY8P57P]|uniref:oligopeptide ABC transporter permease n=1 Tax=Staphylococcus sp. GDY8P57P TaxID=2804128 RepID=UPI0018810872|nr:oligopeptide ABC transporter permease [Staphylococcus sp. GDY8P57P]MBF2756995.1 ABC transporter permease [Staphylococcus haemolyticus]MBF2773050.1 ABC transporter permease [Staphylococcus haemolyticus]MBF2775334.1 ABC transporter permease [Staphylococcus haemolyticus]MBF2814635.1 ABC transporter permease [Staphylococcus haemolyticus]MBF9720887.1 ABC transporter permease [Staphylococcus haemolyticus]